MMLFKPDMITGSGDEHIFPMFQIFTDQCVYVYKVRLLKKMIKHVL